MRICQRDIEKKMKIQYHSVKKNYKKLATRAISAGHLASFYLLQCNIQS